jgi:Flp pilus assembly protein TadG
VLLVIPRPDPVDRESGGVLVMVTLWLPILMLFVIFVLDVGNWFMHQRHLQTQADAAALAAAGDFRIPCTDTPILDRAADYSGHPVNYTSGGTAYNAQVDGPGTNRQSHVRVMFNSPTYYNQSSPVDSTVQTGGPCTARMIDVKLTETDLPWYFGVGRIVPFINAHARVEIKPVSVQAGALPVGVPDVDPQAGRVILINEATGATITSSALVKAGGGAGNLVYWDNSTAPLSFTMPNAPVGVRIILSGATSTTCGDPLVVCYDPTDTTHGLSYIRSWDTTGTAPIVHDAYLTTAGCTNAYFNAGGCTIGLSADIDVGANGATGVTMEATLVGSGNNPPAWAMSNQGACTPASATCNQWRTTSPILIPAGSGPVTVYLHWKKTSGTWNGLTCRNGGSNPCEGFIPVQRTFRYSGDRSGPIKDLVVSEGGVGGANSFKQGTARSLTVRIGITGSLGYASSVSDPPVYLRVNGSTNGNGNASQNQSLDCDPAVSQLSDEIAHGCRPQYTKNTGTACPAGASALWATAQPWSCVAIQTGSATNEPAQGLNERVLGSSSANTCPAAGQLGHNNWSMFPNIPTGDPRVIQVFLTPFGSFNGSGSGTVPVTNFATFYVTGWTAQGNGFANPCQGNGDDLVPGNDPGVIVGHFIRYVQTLNTGGGGPGFCDLTAGGSLGSGTCVAVLTQ